MQRIICEEEPAKPSTKLSTMGEALTDIAKHRHVQPDQLCKIVRGDLDWVVMKALEKDRTRRYETANEFAQDIGRHLGDEPVSAGPPSVGYRLRKFVRRNRAWVAGIAAVLVVLIAGIVVSTFFAVMAVRQAKIWQAAFVFLKNDILASVDREKAKGGKPIIHHHGLEAIPEKIEVAPLVEASIREMLGGTYMSLGAYKAAELHMERVLEIRREKLGEEHPHTLHSMHNLSNVYLLQAHYDEAEPLRVELLEIECRVLGEEHRDTLSSLNRLIELYEAWGKPEKAEQWRATRPPQ